MEHSSKATNIVELSLENYSERILRVTGILMEHYYLLFFKVYSSMVFDLLSSNPASSKGKEADKQFFKLYVLMETGARVSKMLI